MVPNFSSTQLQPRLKTSRFWCKFKNNKLHLPHGRLLNNFTFELEYLNPENAVNYLNEISGTINKFYYSFNPGKLQFSLLLLSHFNLLRKFGTNTNLIVTWPNKGKGVVILYRATYDISMLKIILHYVELS